jgi:hypothetical protein
VTQETPRAGRPGSRMVAVLVTGSVTAAAPPGVEPAAFGRALVEDTADLVAGLEMVAPAVAVSPDGEAALGGVPVGELVWPGTPVIRLAGDGRSGLAARALGALADLGANQAAVLAADAPDLPPLLIGKLLRALGTQRRAGGARPGGRPAGSPEMAICPAEGGGLVALAAWLPAPSWLAGVHALPDSAELDVDDMAERLRRAAPSRAAVRNGPGWHRMRSPADVARLDPGLEGWDATRELLFAR